MTIKTRGKLRRVVGEVYVPARLGGGRFVVKTLKALMHWRNVPGYEVYEFKT